MYKEFDSVEALNEEAEELLKAGNEKEIINLAINQGIDKDEAQDYIRYRNDIDTNSYIRYDGKNFVIDSVIDVGYEHKMLEINCYEYTNKGSVPDE